MLWTLLAVILIAVIIYMIYDNLSRRPLIKDITRCAVFITGCDSGFGAALAQRLDALGVRVFAGCLTDTGGLKLQQDRSSRLRVVNIDVTKSDSVQKAYNTIRDILEPGEVLWGIVNNAGVSAVGGPLDFLNRQEFQDIFNVNVFGMAEVTRIFLPLLKKSKGRIVNMTSILGVQAIPLDISYSASKFAAEGLSDLLRRTLYMWGITVHLIEPSLFKTAISEEEQYLSRKRSQWAKLPADVKEEYGEEYYNDALQVTKKILNNGDSNVDLVVDAYQHALLARRPRLRYQVGKDSKLLYALIFVPATLSDFIIKLVMVWPLPQCLRKRK